MNYTQGIGIDIEDINRFSKECKNENHFYNKIFTKKEQSYCTKQNKPSQHFAARYCAKEAAIKAFGSFGIDNINYKNIEIVNNKNGSPHLRLSRSFSSKWEGQVSLSHDKDKAIAMVILFKK